MTRKTFVQTLTAMVLPGVGALRAQTGKTHVEVFKTASCGCCGLWIEHMKKNGFDVHFTNVDDTQVYRAKYGVPEKLASCHTAVVEGYAVEGHVPSADIRHLLTEKPAGAKGLSVPGMVAGSPGMEGPTSEAYSVVLFAADGKTSVYKSYPKK